MRFGRLTSSTKNNYFKTVVFLDVWLYILIHTNIQTFPQLVISDFLRGVGEILALLGCYATLVGSLPSFPCSLWVPMSRVTQFYQNFEYTWHAWLMSASRRRLFPETCIVNTASKCNTLNQKVPPPCLTIASKTVASAAYTNTKCADPAQGRCSFACYVKTSTWEVATLWAT